MTSTTLYGGAAHRRVTILDLRAAKERGEKWAMLTSYEQMTAAIFDEAGIPVLLVGDSAGNNFLGGENNLPFVVWEEAYSTLLSTSPWYSCPPRIIPELPWKSRQKIFYLFLL